MRTDRFGVPDNLMGPHPDDFFGRVGRVVTLSALLENRLLGLVQLQAGPQHPPLNKLPPSKLIAKGREHLDCFADPTDLVLAKEFFTRAKQAMEKRNDVVHNLWPAQDDGTLFGWRISHDQPILYPAITTEHMELQELVITLVELLADCQSISMRARPPRAVGLPAAGKYGRN